MASKQKAPVVAKKNRSVRAFETAFFSLLEEHECGKISITDILEKSGYSRTAFYSNYLDKKDFIEKTLHAEVANHVHGIYDVILEHPNSLFDGAIYLPAQNLFRHVYERRNLYHALLAGKIEDWDNNRFASECGKCFEALVRVHPAEFPQLNYSLYNYIETFRYINYIAYWDSQNFCYTPEYMAEQAGIMLRLQNELLLDTMQVLE